MLTSPAPPSVRVFSIVLEGPHLMRKAAGAVRFEALAALVGISVAEVMQLMEHKGLRVGYRLHAGCSASPPGHTGYATVEIVNAGILRWRFVLPNAAFGVQPLRLLHVGLLYEGIGNFEDWGYPGAWMAIGTPQEDLFKHYFDTFNLDRI